MADEIKIKVSDADAEPLEELEGLEANTGNLLSSVGGFVGSAVKFGFGLATLPLNVLPATSRYHAKNAVREGFLTVRSIVDNVNDTIDKGLSKSMEKDKVKANLD
jgi:hypothetical protein